MRLRSIFMIASKNSCTYSLLLLPFPFFTIKCSSASYASHFSIGVTVRLIDVRTELMGADMMTKSVGPAVLGVNRKLIGMQICG